MIKHIPIDQNVVVRLIDKSAKNIINEIPNHKRHMFVDDSIQRIFRSEEEGMEEAEILEEVQEEGEQSEQGEEDYDAYGNACSHLKISQLNRWIS